MSVLRRAVDAGANLVITSEPTFYGRADARTPPAGRGGGRGAPPPPDTPPPSDPVYTAKNAFIEKHGLVVFRLNQHWRLRRPDPFATGLAAALGWSKRVDVPGDALRYSIATAPLSALAAELKKKLGSRGGIRVIGDPQTRVQTVALLPGSTPLAAALDALPSVDVIVAGEVREWESVEYARDVVASGQRKGLVLDRPHRVRRGRHERVRALAHDARLGSPRPPYPGWRSLLEPVMTAGEVIERIKKNLGAPWRDTTYRDTFKFGGPETVVTGIATTAFVTLDVVKRAAAARLNMIIPHEATFWSDRDDTAVVSRDPLYAAKVELMKKHDIVVFRIHDHMHAQRPDFTFVGSARDVGLDSRYETAPGSHRFVIPETTLGALAADVKRPHRRARAARGRRPGREGEPDPARRRLRHARHQHAGRGRRHQRRAAGGRRRVRRSLIRRRCDDAGSRQGLDHARARRLGRGGHARDGAVDQRVRAGGAGAAGQGRGTVLDPEVAPAAERGAESRRESERGWGPASIKKCPGAQPQSRT